MWLCCLLACIFFDEKCSYSYFCVSLNECVIFLCWILRSSLYPWFSENLITWLFGGGGHFLCVFSLGLSYLDLWVFSFHQIRKKLTITSSNIFPLFSLFLLGSYLHIYYTFWYWNTKCLLFYFSPFFFFCISFWIICTVISSSSLIFFLLQCLICSWPLQCIFYFRYCFFHH